MFKAVTFGLLCMGEPCYAGGRDITRLTMSDCCSSSSKLHETPKKYRCPVDGELYSSVPSTTILHHIKEPWKWDNKEQVYYFCNNPSCDVVYFADDNSVITKSLVRTNIGAKETSPNALICYCFGVSKAESTLQGIKEFVVKKTKEKECTCTTRNPSGRCCLKDFR